MDGTRFLFNKGDTTIRWQSTDVEGADIIKQGHVCAIYDISLLHAHDAVLAMASDGNLNASVQWGEDGRIVWGSVHAMIGRMAHSQGGPDTTVERLAAS